MSKGTVLITGASSGIGAALARQFAKNDYDLVITARREKSLQELKDSIDSGISIEVVRCDLTDSNGPDELIKAIEAKSIDVDILINNAGIAASGKFDELDQEDIDNLLSLNILALTRLTRHYAEMMVQRGSGRILNVASVAAFQPVPSMNVYAASKAYVLSLTESLSEELRGTGVSVSALCPGLTQTEMVDSLAAQNAPPFLVSSADDVAKEGFDALMAKDVIRIPGLANQAAVTWAQHQPRWLIRGLGGLFSRLKP
ncbi:MAG: SDR family oxidoreductase [Gammaproteobacteria bacterium]|nr:SDR family oxidoreductase [Gammaproteobacteria bacterium]